ncbi:hypothetical protein GQ53DRAFT_416994 [Thozetella sp. PMI_491]|nr:hypothetical protein GQ53DRAFT_416994 [Thozetella sp. PMI_491]
MVQIVLNLDSLSRAFHASNVLRYNDLSGFAIGFCRAQPLFSIVDVGAGKEQADQKVRKMFEVMQSDTHCKHIVFGGCHDNGYAPFLRPYSGDPEVASKITLLETARLGAEFYNLNFGRVKFDGVFRTENIPSRTLPSNDQPVALRAVKDATPPAAPARVTSPAVSVISTVDMDGTWASVGRNGAIAKMIDIGSKKYARRYVQVNKKEQRIDCKLPPPEPAAHRRIQEAMRANSANYCNRYHLLSNCPSTGEYCQFVHGDRLVGVELNVLRNMARGILCHDMSRCRDVTCVLGHHCRTPNNCTFGAKCRFRESHNMDQAVVLKIYEDGTTELAR